MFYVWMIVCTVICNKVKSEVLYTLYYVAWCQILVLLLKTHVLSCSVGYV